MAEAVGTATAANVVGLEIPLRRPSKVNSADERPPEVLPAERGLREQGEDDPQQSQGVHEQAIAIEQETAAGGIGTGLGIDLIVAPPAPKTKFKTSDTNLGQKTLSWSAEEC